MSVKYVFPSAVLIALHPDRLEASRKYLFGSVGVLGKANDSVISGVFIARGPEIQPVVEAAPDWESYTYEKLNPFENGPQKEFFEGALAWDLEVNGKKWADGKNVSVGSPYDAFSGLISPLAVQVDLDGLSHISSLL